MEKFYASERYVTIFDFLSKFFCLTVAKNFVGEPFCAVFHKNFGSEKVKGWARGEYQDFPSKTFCLTVPKEFVREPFSVSLISGAEKVWIREGGLSRFSVENYLSHSAVNFRGWRESFSVSFILGIDKVWTRGGEAVSRFFGQNFLSHSTEKFSKGTL